MQNKIEDLLAADEKMIFNAKPNTFKYVIDNTWLVMIALFFTIACTVATQVIGNNRQLLLQIDVNLIKLIFLILGLVVIAGLACVLAWTIYTSISNAKKYQFVLTDKRIIVSTNNKQQQLESHYFSDTTMFNVETRPANQSEKISTYSLKICYQNNDGLTINITTLPLKDAINIAQAILQQTKKNA